MSPIPEASRRTVLSVAAAAGLLATAGPALPAAAYAPPRTVVPAQSLRTIAPGAGVKRVYKDVFKAATFMDMIIVPDLSGVPKLVTAMTGNTNQFQVFDAATGVREHTVSVPGKITSTLMWNPVTKEVLVGASGELMAWSFASPKVVSRGKVAPGASAVYGFDVDPSGRVWGGSYPGGIIWSYDPKTKAFAQMPAMDSDTDYVKSVGVWKDTVFAGTGSRKPRLISFPAGAPAQRTTIPLPESGDTGFVHRIIVRGDKLFVFAEDKTNTTRCYIYNPVKKAWEGQYKLKQASRAFSDPSGTTTWHTAQGSLVKTNLVTMADEILCTTNITTARALHVAGDKITLAGVHRGEPVIATYSISGKKEASRIRADVLEGSLTVQSLIGSDRGLLYFGGYQGDGLGSLDPVTDARWQCPSTVGISQIEHLMQYSRDKLYIGSYGSAKLYAFDQSKVTDDEDESAFTHITTLRQPYMQSRPFAWAAAGGKVLTGTVPEYGFRGGALAMIDPTTDTLGTVINKFIPEQSIVGLAGYGDIAYGTTSARGGYGIEDHTGDACVFAYNPRTDRTLWTSYLKGYQDLYSPILLDGVLYVATINGLLALDPSTGKLQRTLMLRSRTARPGYQSARALLLPGTTKIVHSSGNIVMLIDVAANTQSLLAKDGFGTQIAIMPDGRLFASHQNNHIAELHTAPTGSIPSGADQVTITAAGDLMLARSDGAGGFSTPEKIGSGWCPGTIKSFHVTDWNGDGVLDILVQRTSGVLQVYTGKPGGGFNAPTQVMSGWSTREITVGPWVKGPYPTVISVDSAGSVRRHPVGASGGIGQGYVIGSGWAGRQIVMIDMLENGRQGLLGRTGAKLILQPSNGASAFSGSEVQVASAGWSDTRALASVKNHFRAKTGLVSIKKTGALQYISSQGDRFGGIINTAVDLRGSLLAGSSRN